MQRVTACIHSRKKNTCEYAKESTILLRWKGEQGKPVSIFFMCRSNPRQERTFQSAQPALPAQLALRQS
jgi:hypothetical protein